MDTSCGIEGGRRLSLLPPELAIVLFSFLLNYPWEMLHDSVLRGHVTRTTSNTITTTMNSHPQCIPPIQW